jgi:hypothetical protein
MNVSPLILLAVGCGPKDAAKSGNATASILSETTTSDGLVEEKIDINGDESADVFNFYRERSEAPRLLVRKETDLNWDGRVDARTWFNELGQIDKEEFDGDFDSKVDWVDHYQGGRRVMSEVDTDWNGVFDLFRYYEGTTLRRKERDTNGDGKVDYWEYFDDAGAVTKTGKDVDGDGVMDVREE